MLFPQKITPDMGVGTQLQSQRGDPLKKTVTCLSTEVFLLKERMRKKYHYSLFEKRLWGTMTKEDTVIDEPLEI